RSQHLTLMSTLDCRRRMTKAIITSCTRTCLSTSTLMFVTSMFLREWPRISMHFVLGMNNGLLNAAESICRFLASEATVISLSMSPDHRLVLAPASRHLREQLGWTMHDSSNQRKKCLGMPSQWESELSWTQ